MRVEGLRAYPYNLIRFMPAEGLHMSDHIFINGQSRPYTTPQTILQLLQVLKTPVGSIAVAVNDRIVPKSRHADVLLTSGDRVEIVHAVGGG